MNVHRALEPVRLGRLELPNRFAVAPMTRVSATPGGVPTQQMADYYGDFAAGGFGLVITEGTYPDTRFSQGYFNQPGLATEEHIAGWQQVTARVRAAGGTIVAQLMHAGALSQGNVHATERVGPSAIPPVGEMMPEYGGSGPWPVPRAMTPAEITEVLDGFIDAARNARAAGFDGVEVHAANGYLLDQFLTVYTNRRADAYGGPVTNRIRLTAEIAGAISAERPPGFLVGVRLSQTKVNDHDYRWPGGAREGAAIFEALAAAGADYVHLASEGRDWLETSLLDDGRTITALARRTSGLPVIANGGMHDLAQAELVLADGHADLLSIGRGALANPDLPRLVAKGVAPARFDRSMIEPMVTLANVRRWRHARRT